MVDGQRVHAPFLSSSQVRGYGARVSQASSPASPKRRSHPLQKYRFGYHISLEAGLAPTRTGRDHKKGGVRGRCPTTCGARRCATSNARRWRGCRHEYGRPQTESIYRRHSIVDAKVLEEAAVKLAMLQASETAETRKTATE